SHSGPVIYRDLESGGKIKTRPEVIRREYKKKFKKYLQTLEKGLGAHQINYYRFYTDLELDKAFTRFMEKRKKIIS
ncbi:MAG: hypothetical protein ACQEQC_01395, partial [Elusimicrobiota bacterium]